MAQYLADVEAVATYMQDDTLDSDAVEQALAYATAIIQSACGQRLFYVADDVAVLPWPRTPGIQLPERPVHSVAGIAFSSVGEPVTLLDDPAQWSTEPGGWLYPADARWPSAATRGASVTVTYTHGYEVIPAELQAAAIGLAVRTLHKPTEAYSDDLGNFVQPTSTAGPAQLSKIEREICTRFRTTTRAAG